MRSTDHFDSAFGIKADLTVYELGTQGDLITFFAIISRLVENGLLEDRYDAITRDLRCSCIHTHNIDAFSENVTDLSNHLKTFRVDSIEWDDLPYHRGVFHKDIRPYDLSSQSMFDVVEKYFRLFDQYIEFYPIAEKEGFKILPMYVTPTDIRLSQKYRKMTVEDFEAQASDPLWLREPILTGEEEKVATLFVDASKRKNG